MRHDAGYFNFAVLEQLQRNFAAGAGWKIGIKISYDDRHDVLQMRLADSGHVNDAPLAGPGWILGLAHQRGDALLDRHQA